MAALADQPPAVLYEALAIEQIRAVADVLARAGYVSLEVASALAYDATRPSPRRASCGHAWTGRTR